MNEARKGEVVKAKAIAEKAKEVYDQALEGTPVHSHLFYALVALVVGVLVLRRGEPADVVMAALMAAGLAFAASFLPISIACDYRYLYFLDVTTMTTALYVSATAHTERGNRNTRWALAR